MQELERILTQGLKSTAPAISVAVYCRNSLRLNQAYGCLDPETGEPVTLSTPFDLASVTKLFTVTAFLQQVAAGMVDLRDPVVSIVPEFGRYGIRPIAGGQDPHTLAPLPPVGDTSATVNPEEITFFHLLTHTSGLAPWWALFLEDGPVPPPPGKPDAVARPQRVAKALDLIAGRPCVEQPGQQVIYSDLGLILLGEAVARLAGKETVAEVISERVLAPLGLDESITFNPAEPQTCPATENDLRWRGRRCRGEVHDENAASLAGIAGHAGLFGSAGTVARFGLAWLQAVQGGMPDWLPDGIASKAIAFQAEGRGLGWVLNRNGAASCGPTFSRSSFGHTGFTGTSLWIDPERDLVVALMSNRVYHGRDPEAIITWRPAVHAAICAMVDE